MGKFWNLKMIQKEKLKNFKREEHNPNYQKSYFFKSLKISFLEMLKKLKEKDKI